MFSVKLKKKNCAVVKMLWSFFFFWSCFLYGISIKYNVLKSCHQQLVWNKARSQKAIKHTKKTQYVQKMWRMVLSFIGDLNVLFLMRTYVYGFPTSFPGKWWRWLPVSRKDHCTSNSTKVLVNLILSFWVFCWRLYVLKEIQVLQKFSRKCRCP